MSSGPVVVVDYEAGNLHSVETALRHLGAEYRVVRDPAGVASAARVIFPGVGEARASITVLAKTGLDRAIADFARSGRPLLGICIGCQIIFEHSEERDTRCLGLLPGRVRRFRFEERTLKVPHMGWNTVRFRGTHPLFRGIPDGSFFYFVHSYYPEPARPEDVAAETEYGLSFASIVARDNLAAVQFHAEKSGGPGLQLLANFLEWRP